MINSITSNSVYSATQMPHPKSQEKLTDDQRELMTETLSKFDADTLTEDDAIAIIAAFQEADIKPGQEMAQLMSEFGFDANEIGKLGGAERPQGGHRPPPPPPSDMEVGSLNMSSEVAEELNTLMEQYFSEDVATDEKESILAAMQKIFEETAPETGLINQYA